MKKPTICICQNKGANQIRGNLEADQCPYFRYTHSAIPLLSKSEISSLKPSSVTVQSGLCRTWSEPKLLVFSRTGSYIKTELTGRCFYLKKKKKIIYIKATHSFPDITVCRYTTYSWSFPSLVAENSGTVLATYS